MKKHIIILISLFFVFGCKSEKKRIEGIWDQEKFIEAMVQVQITEAMLRLGYHRIQDSLTLSDSMYAATYRKIGSTEEEFIKNLEYHAKNPVLMEKIYEEVISRLSQMEASRRGLDTLEI